MTDSDSHDAFDDVELSEEDILGTRTFEGGLFSEELARKKAPVNALTGETARDIPTAAQARAFAEDTTRDGGHQRVAAVPSTESMADTGSKPLVSVVCYNSKITRGRAVGRGEYGMPEYENDGYALEQAYRAAAHDSENHEVEMEEADYENGTVSITVRRV